MYHDLLCTHLFVLWDLPPSISSSQSLNGPWSVHIQLLFLVTESPIATAHLMLVSSWMEEEWLSSSPSFRHLKVSVLLFHLFPSCHKTPFLSRMLRIASSGAEQFYDVPNTWSLSLFSSKSATLTSRGGTSALRAVSCLLTGTYIWHLTQDK